MLYFAIYEGFPLPFFLQFLYKVIGPIGFLYHAYSILFDLFNKRYLSFCYVILDLLHSEIKCLYISPWCTATRSCYFNLFFLPSFFLSFLFLTGANLFWASVSVFLILEGLAEDFLSCVPCPPVFHITVSNF